MLAQEHTWILVVSPCYCSLMPCASLRLWARLSCKKYCIFVYINTVFTYDEGEITYNRITHIAGMQKLNSTQAQRWKIYPLIFIALENEMLYANF